MQDDRDTFDKMHPLQQQFVLMPLMHSEDLKEHEVIHQPLALGTAQRPMRHQPAESSDIPQEAYASENC